MGFPRQQNISKKILCAQRTPPWVGPTSVYGQNYLFFMTHSGKTPFRRRRGTTMMTKRGRKLTKENQADIFNKKRFEGVEKNIPSQPVQVSAHAEPRHQTQPTLHPKMSHRRVAKLCLMRGGDEEAHHNIAKPVSTFSASPAPTVSMVLYTTCRLAFCTNFEPPLCASRCTEMFSQFQKTENCRRWNLMGSDGFWWVLMDSDGFWWVLMGSDGFWWVLMGSDGFWWVLVGSDGFWWVLMGSDGFWWVLMGIDGFWKRQLDFEKAGHNFYCTFCCTHKMERYGLFESVMFGRLVSAFSSCWTFSDNITVLFCSRRFRSST